MNILKAIQSLENTRSVSTEYGVLTRYDSGAMASYTLSWRNGETTSATMFIRYMNHPAFILETVWGLEVPYTPNEEELLAWLERYRWEQPSLFAGMDLKKIVEFIFNRKPEPNDRALVVNRVFEYIFNHKEVQK